MDGRKHVIHNMLNNNPQDDLFSINLMAGNMETQLQDTQIWLLTAVNNPLGINAEIASGKEYQQVNCVQNTLLSGSPESNSHLSAGGEITRL